MEREITSRDGDGLVLSKPIGKRKLSLRYRKSSGTYVIYRGIHVLESGFGIRDAIRYLRDLLYRTDLTLETVYKVKRSEIEEFLKKQK